MSRPGLAIDDRYELGEIVGRGAGAEVWAAEDRRLRRSVALKLLGAEAAHRGGQLTDAASPAWRAW